MLYLLASIWLACGAIACRIMWPPPPMWGRAGCVLGVLLIGPLFLAIVLTVLCISPPYRPRHDHEEGV